MKYHRVEGQFPQDILEVIRNQVQPKARSKRKVPVVVVEEDTIPVLGTVDGITCAVIGKKQFCGNYYS